MAFQLTGRDVFGSVLTNACQAELRLAARPASPLPVEPPLGGSLSSGKPPGRLFATDYCEAMISAIQVEAPRCPTGRSNDGSRAT